MGKFYTANQELAIYLVKELNFKFHDREIYSEEYMKNNFIKPLKVQYFTHHNTGKQIKIDTGKNLITLLNKNGYKVKESSSFTNNQLKKFLINN